MSETVLKIARAKLVGLANWLNKQELNGMQTRMRSRFIKRLAEEVKLIESERVELINKYAETEKNEDGKEVLKTVVDNGETRYVIKKNKEEEFTKEIQALYGEEFKVVLTAENEDEIRCIKDIVLNTTYKFGPGEKDSEKLAKKKLIEAEDYDDWATAFEAIN